MEMSVSLIVSIAGFSLLFTWILVELFIQRQRYSESDQLKHGGMEKRTVFTTIVLLSNVLIFTFHLGFCLYEVWKLKTVPTQLIFSATTWVLATIYAFYSNYRSISGEKRWPSVLTFWWIFSCILSAFHVFIYFLTHLKSGIPPDFLLEPNVAELVSFPLSLLLCVNAFCFSYNRRIPEIKDPLLQKEDNEVPPDFETFSNAGIYSRLTFSWLNPLFRKGRTQKLELHHIPADPESETAEKSYSLLQEWLRKQKNGTSSLHTAIAYAFWRPLLLNSLFAGVNTIASYMGPFLITNFVNFLSQKSDDSSHGYGLCLALIFFLAKTVESLSQRQWYFGANRIGIQVRAAVTVLIYRKSLLVKYAGPSNGKYVNLINVDAERIGDFFWYIHGIWLLPLQVLLALVILYRNLGGVPSIAALLTTVLVMISNTPLANLQERLHSNIMETKDARIKFTSEILKSMKILKMHSWETTYLRKLMQLRENERSWLKLYLYICSIVAFLFWASPTLLSVITFGVCILVEAPLTSGAVLSALATFRILQEPIYNLPELISMIAQTKVSIDRVQAFIREEDQKVLQYSYTPIEPDVAIEIETGEYTWGTSNTISKKPTIKISKRMNIMKGDKVAVCGSVGSGKSSLLCSILGEIPRITGAGIKVYGSEAYVPQSAWIQTGTIRDNVLFGKEMDSSFYRNVLEGCALNRDIQMWSDGDLSMVGERGMNLSGGQKQRIQLARALYSDSDIYLLDDPFSAVDAHTGAHLFKECLMRILSQKTVIYVTHQLEFLNASDLVFAMKDGEIVQSGKYEDLIAEPDGELVKQMAAHSRSVSQVAPPQAQSLLTFGSDQRNQMEVIEEKMEDSNGNGKLVKKASDVETESGSVKWKVYVTFVTCAYKGALVPIIILCQVSFQVLQMGSNYWIAWASEEGRVSKDKLIGVFILLSGGSSLFILGRAVLLSTVAIETAQRLFLGMVNSIFRAPISFFDSTPTSRILNRSSTDQSTVDTDIPYRLAGLAFALIQLLSIIILMSQVAWQVFILFLGILAISIWYQAYYITTARELARMVAARKAPILHHFSESIAGAETIRCFKQQDRFLVKNLSLIDEYSRVAFHNSATMEWLCVRINFLFNLVFFLLLLILVILPRAAIDPSLAGLAATYGLNLNVLQAWVIWNLCNVENKMISVERILQFSNIPSEAPLLIEERRPEPEWPILGTVKLENLHIRYSPMLPMVLKGISCTFPGQAKIGVVGRTGSGKSTLIQALFRVVEPSEGRILIDEVDICEIGLQDLRSRLSIIPQDPTLFQGTIRANLDPLEQHSDSEIWEALRRCNLAVTVMQDQMLLDAKVEEDGGNWSLGQRQLFCLARVLLKKRRILVLDEATASVDTATDNLIQRTIREETSNCTVITVAHRIPTVIDNDLVLVLDEGKVLEYDSPTQLLKDNTSAFSKLVTEFLKKTSKREHH
ncbi:putative ABC transporter C family member 15 [Telopea speciosissima]|uniref:putative ABC transporter C family member 15 n=1 Tax=Telopea speciosissima TaxID=54955 RepID=UPI001CC3A6D8|nr:putative ABC transporter C family member 15 [Telopea speciosissima]XP_043687092.1 putative ABC transporter C family member 15 [Telopea speciosissima]